jgi:hypothetical protein
MARKILSLIMLSFSLAIGGFWALRAQDPNPQKPSTTKPEPQTPKTEPQTPTAKMETQTPAATTTQVDLSGTYAGTFNCDAAGLTGDTTITINGNEFTTSDGKSGRIVASKTKGYTAVALQLTGASSPVMSFRGKKSGTKLTLTPVAGSTQQCSFTPSGKMAKATKEKAPTATGTEVSSPAAKPAQTPSPTPTPSPEPTPEPTPSGSPRPRPSPTPAPSPTPGEPTPTPTPTPSPRP